MTGRGRVTVFACATALLLAVASAYVLYAAGRGSGGTDGAGAAGDRIALGTPGRIVFRNTGMGPGKDHLATVAATDPGGARTVSRVSCLRFHASAGTGVCLRGRGGLVPSYEAVILDGRLSERRRIRIEGAPTRARVSPSGRMAAWTVFVSGDSYGGLNFSTRTGVLDTRTGAYIPSLEAFSIQRGSSPYRAADVNFWGVTFADDDRFYATLATAGRTYLVEGSVRDRRVRTLRENVECPSLSPDGSRLVFKKRVRSVASGDPWRLYVLDLRTMAERPLAETRSVDDQVIWTDSGTVMYALPGDFTADLWSVPADGTGAPRKRIAAAISPA
ncbi:hypothetical protein ACRYCC_41630 [Actinomadura scrupuli]|uniref:hypothetical protein n=1 Tax=Actinomadura scrupuli TaxID=559629 RepID=UPI003D992E4B